MVNAHPTILGQYLTKNDIEHPRLEYYISNRDDLFKQLADPAGLNMTRDQAKMLVLKIMNGRKITAEQQRFMPAKIQSFAVEMHVTREAIYELETDLVAKMLRKNGVWTSLFIT